MYDAARLKRCWGGNVGAVFELDALRARSSNRPERSQARRVDQPCNLWIYPSKRLSRRTCWFPASGCVAGVVAVRSNTTEAQ